MPRLLLSVLTLVAVLLVPFGMGGAAMAQPAPAAAEAGHCGEHKQPDQEPAKQQVHCTACTALPAMEEPAPAEALGPEAPQLIARVHNASGIEPEIATPPPKRS